MFFITIILRLNVYRKNFVYQFLKCKNYIFSFKPESSKTRLLCIFLLFYSLQKIYDFGFKHLSNLLNNINAQF